MANRDNAVREVVDHKVRRALGKKALREVRKLVSEFQIEDHHRKRARLFAVLMLIIFVLVAMSVVRWPSISRYVTGMLS